MAVMAGVSWEGSMAENLGRSELSRRGFDAAVVGSATVDMVRAVLVVGQEEEEEEDSGMPWLRAR